MRYYKHALTNKTMSLWTIEAAIRSLILLHPKELTNLDKRSRYITID